MKTSSGAILVLIIVIVIISCGKKEIPCENISNLPDTIYVSMIENNGGYLCFFAGHMYELDASVEGGKGLYFWNGYQSPQKAMQYFDSPGAYSVIRTDSFNDTLDQFIVTIEYCENLRLYIPSAFTPNGDTLNDVWIPRGIEICNMKTVIKTLKGLLVFESDEIAGWNGKYKGTPTPPGLYIYHVEVAFTNEQKKIYNGQLELII